MKLKTMLNRLVSLALMMALVLSLAPGEALAAESSAQYGYLVIHNNTQNRVVNFRAKSNTDDTNNYPIARLPEYWVVEVLSGISDDKGTASSLENAKWFRVTANTNVSGTGAAQMQTGYVLAGFVQLMTPAQQAQWQSSGAQSYNPSATAAPAPVVSPTPVPGAVTPVPASQGYVRTILDQVNLRQTPGGTVLNEKDQIPLGNVMAYYEIVTAGGYSWALVRYNGKTGYVRSDCYALSDAQGNIVSNVTPTPTPAGVAPIDGDGTYGRTTADNVMFRKVMSTTGDYWARLPLNWTAEILGTETKNGVLWYKVKTNTPATPSRTYTGYIHGNFLRVIEGSATPVPSGATESNYGLVTLDAINLRQTPGGNPITVLRVNMVVNIISKPAGTTSNDWYYIEISGVYGYVPATALRVLTTDELGNYVLPPAPVSPVSPATPTPAPGVAIGYVKLVLDKVNLRKTPAGTVLTPTERSKMPVGTVLAYTEGPVTAGGYSWVRVTYNELTGYVRSDCYRFCDAGGNFIDPTPVPAVTSTPIPGIVTPTPAGGASAGYIRLIKSGVNLRTTPWGTSLGQLGRDTVLPCYGTQYYNGSELWYQVYSGQYGAYGYILGTMAVVTDSSGSETTPTPAPTYRPDGEYAGYVATTVSSVWLRTSPWANADTAGQIRQKGTVLPLVGTPVVNGVYTWYPVVTADGTRGYLRGDCVYQLTAEQWEEYQRSGKLPTPTPGPVTPRPGNSSYIQTTSDKLWVRRTPSTKAETLGQLRLGTVTKFHKKQVVGKVTWYQITFNGTSGWVHGSYARVLSNAEYDALKPTATPVATATPVGDLTNLSDLALTTADRVKIRGSASMTGRELTVVYDRNTRLTYLGNYVAPTADNPYYWFNVRYGKISGWMRGDYVRVLTPAEKQQYEGTGNPDAPQEATYRTLSKGSTGEDVTALQQKLVEKGFLAADQVSGYYLTSTESAVIAFQRANGLVVDGIAGSKTQHALFGTVEPGTGGSSTTVTLYPVEKIDWYTGGIQSIWSVGAVAVITDVYTGISFRAQRLYGDNHADCEPKTTADTAAICQIFGVSNAQEISDREQELQSWRRRPLWVTIGGRTFCASMYGIPHNYAGDRIPDNNYNGQFCVHFTNSKKHTNPEVDWDAAYNGYFGAQSAIQYAYTHSTSGQK